jgi:glycosyltransferase involved in cell wall biosynthesis
VVVGPDIPGSPFDRAHCEALARELAAPVRFLGAVPRPSVLSALHAADVYVQGSAFEGFGIGLLEGMAAGKPFVAFDAGAARELSDRGAGVCVGSEEEMARALLAIPAHADEMAGVARTVAREYSVNRMVERTLEVYRSVAVEGPGSVGMTR